MYFHSLSIKVFLCFLACGTSCNMNRIKCYSGKFGQGVLWPNTKQILTHCVHTYSSEVLKKWNFELPRTRAYTVLRVLIWRPVHKGMGGFYMLENALKLKDTNAKSRLYLQLLHLTHPGVKLDSYSNASIFPTPSGELQCSIQTQRHRSAIKHSCRAFADDQ